MLKTGLLRVVVVALATIAVACGDPTRPKATILNLSLSYSLYGLTGAPPATGNAIKLFIGPARADATFDFDVALDLDSTGKRILVYPVRAIAGSLAGLIPTRVGLQTVSGNFESVQVAPDRGYDTLKVQSITPGTTVVAELVDQVSGLCIYSLVGSQQYAKFVVDSVTPARKFYVRSVGDANCGYKSLVPDSIPTF
jgi:hypothetical protein